MKLIKQKADKTRALEILTESFNQSPGINWMFDHKRTLKSFQRFLTMLYKDSEVKKGAFLTKDKNGVVLFYRLQNKKASIGSLGYKLYVSLFVLGIKKSLKAIKYQKLVNSIRPKCGWIGMLIATDKYTEGNIAAVEINQEMFRLADATNESIYLETTVPKIMLLHKAAGYIEYNQIKHPYENLTLWFLRRNPNPLPKI